MFDNIRLLKSLRLRVPCMDLRFLSLGSATRLQGLPISVLLVGRGISSAFKNPQWYIVTGREWASHGMKVTEYKLGGDGLGESSTHDIGMRHRSDCLSQLRTKRLELIQDNHESERGKREKIAALRNTVVVCLALSLKQGTYNRTLFSRYNCLT